VTEIRAPIVGSVVAVNVEVGDALTPELVVVLLESMKLEIPVEAEEYGVVVEVLVAVGETVQEDALLLRFDLA